MAGKHISAADFNRTVLRFGAFTFSDVWNDREKAIMMTSTNF